MDLNLNRQWVEPNLLLLTLTKTKRVILILFQSIRQEKWPCMRDKDCWWAINWSVIEVNPQGAFVISRDYLWRRWIPLRTRTRIGRSPAFVGTMPYFSLALPVLSFVYSSCLQDQHSEYGWHRRKLKRSVLHRMVVRADWSIVSAPERLSALPIRTRLCFLPWLGARHSSTILCTWWCFYPSVIISTTFSVVLCWENGLTLLTCTKSTSSLALSLGLKPCLTHSSTCCGGAWMEILASFGRPTLVSRGWLQQLSPLLSAGRCLYLHSNRSWSLNCAKVFTTLRLFGQSLYFGMHRLGSIIWLAFRLLFMRWTIYSASLSGILWLRMPTLNGMGRMGLLWVLSWHHLNIIMCLSCIGPHKTNV